MSLRSLLILATHSKQTMSSPQSSDPQMWKKNVELFKTANAQTSLICEAMLGRSDLNGKLYNKIGLILVLRDEKNKAVKTLRYYLDVPSAKVIFHDLWVGTFPKKYSEFKKGNGMERALNINLQDNGMYQFSVLNTKKDLKKGEERQNLYFNLNTFQVRQMAITVLDHLKNYELALALAPILQSKRLSSPL